MSCFFAFGDVVFEVVCFACQHLHYYVLFIFYEIEGGLILALVFEYIFIIRPTSSRVSLLLLPCSRLTSFRVHSFIRLLALLDLRFSFTLLGEVEELALTLFS